MIVSLRSSKRLLLAALVAMFLLTGVFVLLMRHGASGAGDLSVERASAVAPAAIAPRAPGVTLKDGDPRLNEAGLPVGPALAPAKPVPVAAAAHKVVGYRTGAGGEVREIKAGELRGVAANSPGTYAVVDMWADGGPQVVEPTEPGDDGKGKQHSR